jgi:2-polyprenyl-3-methyl-5-hydroxy-6-metoxy-1,4-benzoquinol methylase
MLPDELSQRIRGFQESRVLLTAIELDLFTAIGQGATPEQAASALGANPRATGMLMHALVSLGMLEKSGGVFRNSPEAARYFVKSSPDDQRMATMHIVNLWTRWSKLTDCVRSGTAVERRETAGPGDDWAESFIAAMHANASERAPAVVRAVGAEAVDRMLDIGGGSGAYSIAFAKTNPRLQSEILDLESVLPIARRHIAEAGVADRVTARMGDLRAGGFGAGYGLVFISAICHMLSPEENRQLLANSFAALRPGGRVAVQDFILDPDRTGPPWAALFALNMLVGTASGNTYTEEEYASWLRAAGFASVQRVNLPGPADLMLATRTA